MAHDLMAAVHITAARLKASAPEAFDDFNRAVNAYGQGKLEQLVRCDPAYLPRAQGQAQTAEEVCAALLQCTEVAAKLANQAQTIAQQKKA